MLIRAVRRKVVLVATGATDKGQQMDNKELLNNLVAVFHESVISRFSDSGDVYERAQAHWAEALAGQDVWTERDVWLVAFSKFEYISQPPALNK